MAEPVPEDITKLQYGEGARQGDLCPSHSAKSSVDDRRPGHDLDSQAAPRLLGVRFVPADFQHAQSLNLGEVLAELKAQAKTDAEKGEGQTSKTMCALLLLLFSLPRQSHNAAATCCCLNRMAAASVCLASGGFWVFLGVVHKTPARVPFSCRVFQKCLDYVQKFSSVGMTNEATLTTISQCVLAKPG